jgi:hypothetical protein
MSFVWENFYFIHHYDVQRSQSLEKHTAARRTSYEAAGYCCRSNSRNHLQQSGVWHERVA